MNSRLSNTVAAKRPYLHERMRIKNRIREFFTTRHYLEVETPYLVPTPGEEVHLHPFQSTFESYQGERQQCFLHTSPEFAMKRIVAAIKEPIFQFARVWRNGEVSPNHTPEFTMLEWYTPRQDFDGLLDQTETLIKTVTPPYVTRQHRQIAMHDVFERLTVKEAFIRFCHFDVFQTQHSPQKLSQDSGYKLREDETWEDLFFRIFLEKIEPQLGTTRPTFLTHWPQQMAALARRDPKNPEQALRFELYCGGLELTNGFAELTDPIEQKERFDKDRAIRRKLYPSRTQWPMDKEFLNALQDLPPCSGNALGFDRLVMLATNAKNIKDVQWL